MQYRQQHTPQIQQQLRQENEELKKENEELRNSVQTLLEYNNKLLTTIEDLLKERSTYGDHQKCNQQMQSLWGRMTSLEGYCDELEREVEHHRASKYTIEQLGQKKLTSEGDSDRERKENRLNEVAGIEEEIRKIRNELTSAGERLIEWIKDKDQKIQEIHSEFRQKDQAIEMVAVRVKYLEENKVRARSNLSTTGLDITPVG